jgi:hypothetical protein
MPKAVKIAPSLTAHMAMLDTSPGLYGLECRELRALLAVAKAVDRWRNRVATQEEVEGAMERASLRLERISKGAK